MQFSPQKSGFSVIEVMVTVGTSAPKAKKEVVKLHPIRFSYKKENPMGLPSDLVRTGFIAQEVQQVLPEAVHENAKGYLELNVDPIHWAVVNALKELYSLLLAVYDRLSGHDKTIASLQAENSTHAAKIQHLLQKNAALKARLDRLEQAAPAH